MFYTQYAGAKSPISETGIQEIGPRRVGGIYQTRGFGRYRVLSIRQLPPASNLVEWGMEVHNLKTGNIEPLYVPWRTCDRVLSQPAQ